MQAAEIGVRIEVDAVINLLGASAVILRVKGPNDAVFRSLTMIISVPTNLAIRDTVAADFPDAGNYFVQLRSNFPDGRDLYSALVLINVGEVVSAVTCS